MNALRLWKSRERKLEERVRLLESQVFVLATRLGTLEAHAVTKQFGRVKS